MGQPIARITDIGVGQCSHPSHNGTISMSGYIITSAQTVYAYNKKVARVGDIVIGMCGHSGTIVTGSSNVITENKKTARVGDQFIGDFTGIIISGDNYTKVGG